jgi:uncharacterized damage-inducible protein DinB
MARPQVGDYGSFYQTYINYTTEHSIDGLIEAYSLTLNNYVQQLPDNKANYAYASNKWTVKQVLQHTIDTERIFTYRALAIGRGDTTALPGFDENQYAINGTASNRALQALKEEFVAVRKSTDLLLLSFAEQQLQQVGTASNHAITCNALCYILFGHVLHHKRILEERYL